MSLTCKIKYYVPAHDEAALREAIESDAEVIVMDLEQNCPPEKKGEGRSRVQRALAALDFKGSKRWVRVNIAGSKELEEDLESLDRLPDGVVLARLAVEVRAAGAQLMDTVTPISASDEYLERDTREAFKLGYKGRAVLTARPCRQSTSMKQFAARVEVEASNIYRVLAADRSGRRKSPYKFIERK
ncbi:MAG: aldolase/citrate lyase family protein [Nitrospinota bacterium]